jgi:uncharacterized membrane protein
MNTLVGLTGALGLGAGLAYLLDPDRGRRRRALASDQMISAAHAAGDAVETTSRDVRNRALGTIASVRSRFAADEVSDDVLEERVRARLGSVVRHPGSIEVSARDGCVTLRGPILAGDVNRLLRRVGAVRGVRSVDNQLEVHRAPDDVPGLQGEGRLPGPRPAFMQTVWSPTERLVAGAAGAWLTLYGVRQPGLVRSVAGLAGLGLLARAFTNLELKRLVGVGAGRRAVTVQKTLHINAPVEEVFDLWSHYENFPRFMTHVREIRRSEGGRSRWTVAGPGGMPLEWETIETAHEPNRRIAWKTVEGAPVAHAGVVRFDPTPEGGTRVDIKLSYNPPAGALGHGLASLLGQDPKRALDDDLLRMKSLLEDGRTRAHGQAVTREQLRRV